jgi:WD40 repeat protein
LWEIKQLFSRSVNSCLKALRMLLLLATSCSGSAFTSTPIASWPYELAAVSPVITTTFQVYGAARNKAGSLIAIFIDINNYNGDDPQNRVKLYSTVDLSLVAESSAPAKLGQPGNQEFHPTQDKLAALWNVPWGWTPQGDKPAILNIYSWSGGVVSEDQSVSAPLKVLETVAWSPTGDRLAVAGYGAMGVGEFDVVIYDPTDLSATYTSFSTTCTSTVKMASWTPDGSKFIVSWYKGIQVYDGTTYAAISSMLYPAAELNGVSIHVEISPDGTMLAAGGEHLWLRIYSTASLAMLASQNFAHNDCANCCLHSLCSTLGLDPLGGDACGVSNCDAPAQATCQAVQPSTPLADSFDATDNCGHNKGAVHISALHWSDDSANLVTKAQIEGIRTWAVGTSGSTTITLTGYAPSVNLHGTTERAARRWSVNIGNAFFGASDGETVLT